ncbi:hypothetical protein Hanom_Chr10g00926941 [Helianthus anomalus]
MLIKMGQVSVIIALIVVACVVGVSASGIGSIFADENPTRQVVSDGLRELEKNCSSSYWPNSSCSHLCSIRSHIVVEILAMEKNAIMTAKEIGEFKLELENAPRHVPWCSVNPYPSPENQEKEMFEFSLYFNGPKPFEVTVKAGEILYL